MMQNNYTPLLEIESNWLIKLDCFLAGHSHKARAAQYIVEKAIKNNDIILGKTTIIEKTGGNFGLGLILAGRKYNIPVDLAIGLSFSPIKRQFLSKHGANLIGLDMLNDGLQPKDVIAYHLENQARLNKHYFYTDQFNNIASIEAHEFITGAEIIQQLKLHYPDVNKLIFVTCAGTGAHLTGISYALKNACYQVDVVLVEPENCDTKNNVHNSHIFEGMNVGVLPPFLDWGLITDIQKVSSIEALEIQKYFSISHGYYFGMTSCACLAVSQKLIKKINKNCKVLNLIYDQGFWY
jgi:cysteine synthase